MGATNPDEARYRELLAEETFRADELLGRARQMDPNSDADRASLLDAAERYRDAHNAERDAWEAALVEAAGGLGALGALMERVDG